MLEIAIDSAEVDIVEPAGAGVPVVVGLVVPVVVVLVAAGRTPVAVAVAGIDPGVEPLGHIDHAAVAVEEQHMVVELAEVSALAAHTESGPAVHTVAGPAEPVEVAFQVAQIDPEVVVPVAAAWAECPDNLGHRS